MASAESHTGELIVYSSKAKLVLIAVGSLLLILVAVFAGGPSMPSTPAQWAGRVLLAVVATAFFGTSFVYAVRRMIDNLPALRIDGRGIDDRSAASSIGFMPWSEIDSFFVTQIGMQRMLCIVPKNIESFIERQPLLKRRAMWMNLRLVGAPLAISTVTLPVSQEDLIAAIAHHIANSNR